MKKLLLFVLLALILFGFIFYHSLPSLLSSRLSKDLRLPVSIEKLIVSFHSCILENVTLDNPPSANTKTAFTAKSIRIDSSFSKIREKPAYISSIAFQGVHIYVELYDANGKKNNWKEITNIGGQKEKDSSRSFFIEKLSLTPIDITLIYPDGRKLAVPPIPYLELRNLSNKNGYAFDKIEQVILNQIMKEVYKQSGFKTLLDTLNPIPLPIPNMLPFPF